MLTIKEPYNQLSDADKEALNKICNLITVDKPNIVEIGCWLGHSTSILAGRAKELDGKVICIDTFMGSKGVDFLEEYAKDNSVYNEFINNIKELGLGSFVNTFLMDSSEAYKFIPDKSCDLIFIDGDHRYEQVKEDIDNYLPKVKIGGVIAGHDYEIGFNLKVSDFTEEDLSKDMSKGFHCGVIKAVYEKFPAYNLIGDRVWWLYV